MVYQSKKNTVRKINHEEVKDQLKQQDKSYLQDMKIINLRFTRVLFGSCPSPHILGATLEEHHGKYVKDYNQTTKELLKTYMEWKQSIRKQWKRIFIQI